VYLAIRENPLMGSRDILDGSRVLRNEAGDGQIRRLAILRLAPTASLSLNVAVLNISSSVNQISPF
jgi:hypothetical protein